MFDATERIALGLTARRNAGPEIHAYPRRKTVGRGIAACTAIESVGSRSAKQPVVTVVRRGAARGQLAGQPAAGRVGGSAGGSTPAARAAAANRSLMACAERPTTRSVEANVAAPFARRPDGPGDVALDETDVGRLAVGVRLAAEDGDDEQAVVALRVGPAMKSSPANDAVAGRALRRRVEPAAGAALAGPAGSGSPASFSRLRQG